MPTFLPLSGVTCDNNRVTAHLGTHPLWFESADLPLDPTSEAPASALLMATAVQNAHLDIADPVSPQWLANTHKIMQIWNRWWNYPILPPRALTHAAPRPIANAAALCFTGGIDSFFTLLRGPRPPEFLAFVHGYDMPLSDSQRFTVWEKDFRSIAAAVNAKSILIRSNLREDPYFDGQNWERSHGGGIAAIGHLLAPHAGTLYIASSFPPAYNLKWGSHAELDPLWSSDRLTIIHHGATHSRVGKVRELVTEPLVQKYLRVCWENTAPTGNCSACDKCLCTMLLIAAHSSTTPFTTFNWQINFPKSLNRLRFTRFQNTYKEFLALNPDPKLARSIRALLARTSPKSFLDRFRRFTHRRLHPR